MKLLLVVAVALVDPDGRVLISERPQGKALAGLWEFPGGKIEPGERPEATLIRELKEELGIDVADGRAQIGQGLVEAGGLRAQLTGHVDLEPSTAALRLSMQPFGSGAGRPPLVVDLSGPLRRLNLGLGEATAR